MNISQRYATATTSSNLKPRTEQQETGDTDVLGAYAIASKRLTEGCDRHGNIFKPAPLAVPLERLLTGDGSAATEIVKLLADKAFTQSWAQGVKISRMQCDDMAKACLAWWRDGVCKVCGGHGKTLIPGSKSFSDHDCQACRGTGKIKFEVQFKPEHRELANWLVDQVEREVGRAGPAAMRALGNLMDGV